MEPLTNENFIESLKLPTGVVPKHFEGMNRYHFKYYGDGFVVLDLQNNYYHLRAREDYLKAVNVFDYTLDHNYPSKPATIKNIPYEDTTVFYKLVEYITQENSDDINKARKPESIFGNGEFTFYTCPRCSQEFKKARRCPECGQLIEE